MMKELLSACLILGTLASQAAVDHWETIVYNDDARRYIVPSAQPSALWTQISFNDAAWLQGPGGIGYADGDDNTSINPAISVYQRLAFNVVDINKIEGGVLNIDYDDAFVAYLNGVEIARENIGTVGIPPAWDDGADGWVEANMYQGGQPNQYVLDLATLNSLLVNGNNVLAIQFHNESLGSSDMSSLVWFSVGINDQSSTYGTPPTWFVPPVVFTSSDLPILVMNTNGQAIPDEPKITANLGIIDNGTPAPNLLTDPHNIYSGEMGIELRGSTSQSIFPKKGYAIETRDGLGNNNNISLLGMPAENDWILHGPYSDKSLMRNALEYDLSRSIGHWAPRTRHVEVVINGEYMGVYVLMERIKRDVGRVDIATVTVADTIGDELTGGYIMKVDKPTGSSNDSWASPHPPWNGATQQINYQYHHPQFDDLLPVQSTYIRDYITAFEDVMAAPNFADTATGYAVYADVRSFVDFLILNEVSRNVDGYRLSTYLYKDKDSNGGKIVMGPTWDFNLGFGNANYCEGDLTSGWAIDFNNVCPNDNYMVPFYWEKLLTDTTFTNHLYCRWNHLRQGPLHLDSVFARVDSMASYLDESKDRNFNRWPILGTYIWPNNATPPDYAGEIAYLKNWISDRFAWMDANMPGDGVWCSFYLDVPEESLSLEPLRIFPNPADEYTFVDLPSNVGEVDDLVVWDLRGRRMPLPHQASSDFLKVDCSSLANGVYVVEVRANGVRQTGRLVVAR